MERSTEMSTGKIPNLLLKFSLPAIIGLLVNALYNIIDSIFVGRGVGDVALAGVTVGLPIVIILMSFVMLVGMGATALISIRLGENKTDEAEQIIGNALVLFVIIGISLTVLGLVFIKPLLTLFGASAAVLPYATDYMQIIILGSILMAVGVGMNTFIRAEGNPKMAMNTMLIGTAVNIVLDYIFIFVFHWGIRGAAAATIISYAVSSVWVLYYFIAGDSVLKIRRQKLRPNGPIIKEILAVGFPVFALQITTSIQLLVLNRSLAKYGGDIALAAIGIVMNISTLLLMPAIGISQGSQPIIGFNHGAKEFGRIKETLKSGIITATALVTAGFMIARIWPTQLIGLFNDNPQLIELGTHAMKIFFLFLPLVSLQVISSSYFQAVGKPKQATLLSLSRQVLIFTPLVLILPHYWGLDGIWMAAPLADLGAFLIAGICLRRELKALNKSEIANKISPQPVGTLTN